MSNSINGKWISSKPASAAFLNISADGSLTGSDGANRISTTWSGDDSGATGESFLTTQRAAQGMERWVGRTRRVEADGDQLNVFDQAGNHLDVLNRAADADEPDEGR
ncbi:MAG: META domain-containing protein [Brevibacterium sp.]|nr:META domain-containing protein [Brevibacterium sp.]